MLIVLIRGESLFLQTAVQVFSLLSGVLLLSGAYIFTGKKQPILILSFTGLVFLWLIFAGTFQASFLAINLPVYLALSLIFILIGNALLKDASITGAGKYITGISFVLWGLHKADYPFLRPIEGIAPWGYILNAIFEFLVAFGIIIIFFQKTKARLKQSEEEYRELVENSNSIILRLDGMGNITYANEFALRFFEYDKEELIGAPCIGTIVPPKSLSDDDLEAMVHDLVKNPLKYTTNENENIKRSGERVHIAWTNKPVFDEEGKLHEVFCVGNDITNLKKARDELKYSEKRYRELFDNMQSGVAVYEAYDNGENFIIKDLNNSGEKISCIEKAKAIGQKVTDVFPGIEDLGLFQIFQRVCRTGKPETLSMSYYNDKRLELWVENYVYRLPSGEIVAVYKDLTEQKRANDERENLQKQLLQSQKLEIIGRLAGGIAHDFNNILTGIMGYAELLHMKFNDLNTTEGKAASIILKGSERASHLTKQLLGFARKGKYHPVPVNVNKLIKEVISVSEKIFEKNIEIIYNFSESISSIKADYNQIDQIFSNLFINAKDAMPNGGKLIISTSREKLDSESLHEDIDIVPGEYVKISIKDTGMGIPKDLLGDIFEPFFTTKDKGKGTGLGLATVYGIVKNHNGYIFVQSEPGIGTEFTIYFPTTDEASDESLSAKPIQRGTETILIVDDEESVRSFGNQFLTGLGYTVFTAKNGIEAVEIFKINYQDIDLVILDMIMPELDGKSTFKKLKEINKDVKILIATGYSKHEHLKTLLKNGANDFLVKPFNLSDLSHKIRTVLSL